MAEIRVIFGDDDRENEEFLGFDLDNIEEAEKRYILQLYMLNDFDSNIEFSEMGSSDKEEIDSDIAGFSKCAGDFAVYFPGLDINVCPIVWYQ